MRRISCLLGCFVFTSHVFAGAILGSDDRVAIAPGTMAAKISRSTAVAVLSSNIEDAPNNKFNLLVDSSSEFLCPNERFRNEPSLQYACTGFLVAPNLLVTAGHCAVNTGETRNQTKLHCEVFSWLFDYQRTSTGQTQTRLLPREKLYRCKQIIYAVKDERLPMRDYALIELDRIVADREPLQLESAALGTFTRLSMIGYPMGMPAQVVTNSEILLNNPERESFITNLDAIEGNSGSPVFNFKNQVVGILVGGTPTISFVDHPTKKCTRLNRCSTTGLNCTNPEKDTSLFPGFQRIGAEVRRIAPILDLIENR